MRNRLTGIVLGIGAVAALAVGCSSSDDGTSASTTTSTAASAASTADTTTATATTTTTAASTTPAETTGTTESATTTTSLAPTDGPVVLTCAGQPETRPAQIVFYCADANASVRNVEWTAWETYAASGVGTLLQNDCTPNCASGHEESSQVKIGLSAPEGADNHFTVATVTFDDGHEQTFPLPSPHG